jgi:hypothetical protein
MFKNMRILLVCKETFSYPLYHLAKKWREENTVASYFFSPAECMFNQCLLNMNTYHKHNKLENVKIYDSRDIVEHFSDNIVNPDIDYKYLEYIENKYTHYKNINLQLLSTQKMSTYYHDRIYYSPSTYEQQMYWLELNYRNTEKLFESFAPDVIIDLDNSELARAVLCEVAHYKKIPYFTIEYPRYEYYKVPTTSLGIGKNLNMEALYNKFLEGSKSKMMDEYDYVHRYRSKSTIMSDEFKNDPTSKYERDDVLVSLKKLFGKIVYFWNQDITSKNFRIKKENKILFAPSPRYVLFYFLVEVKKWYLFGDNSFFHEPKIEEKYVYMPLHLIPESSTLTMAPFYINELMVIEQVSKSLPVGWILYVKEHQSMLGERALKFYRKVNSLHNVKMVSVNYHRDPKPWIINSMGVITITGTSAYEAALLGKKSIVFGDVPFALIEGVTKIKSFEELPELIKSFGLVDNIHSCAAYIASIKELGMKIDLKYIMAEGEAIISGKHTISSKYEEQIEQLDLFFKTAYSRYKNDSVQK